MPVREELLTAIPGANPAGTDLRYDPVYEKIKDARREDDGGALEGGKAKQADYAAVLKIAGEALAKKSKDLWIAAWLTDAQLRKEGVSGLRDGLELMQGLIERYWDQLYPELEDGDAEVRAAPLTWIGTKLDMPLRLTPLNKSGHHFFLYAQSRGVPSETEAQGDQDKSKKRAAAIEEGKLTPEAFEDGFTGTTKDWYKKTNGELKASIGALTALDTLCQQKFGDAAPTFRGLQTALDEVQRTVQTLLAKKLELDPDPPEPEPEPGDSGSSGGDGGTPRALTVEPVDREDAAARIAGAARFLRKDNPLSPAPFLLLRGFRWGELRSSSELDPKLLVAPPTAVRAQLKGFLLDARWRDLLEACENVMSAQYGRGWLDLQRYALTAIDNLGEEYAAAGAAMRAALASMLHDVPQLLSMTMMDDTPTANGETQAWLRANGLLGAADGAEGSNGDASVEVHEAPVRPTSRASFDRTVEAAKAESPQKAINLLAQEVSRERSPRARFLRRTQMAEIMVDAGLEAVALPVLQQLSEEIEAHQLETWEEGTIVALPLALLYRCYVKLGYEAERDPLYQRICRLDPVQAMGVS
jgi:type VI secretion system protein ImpA